MPFNGKSNIHYFWLDWLRFASCLTVVISHGRDMFFPAWDAVPPEIKNLPLMFFYLLSRLGHEAVIVFFVLSGFLVGGNVLRKVQQNNFKEKKFTVDRAVRILLPLIGSLLFLGVTDYCFGYKKSLWSYVASLLSLQGIVVPPVSGPFWSLNYEVWFYVICGAFGSLMMCKEKPSCGLSFFCWGLLLLCAAIYSFLKPVYLIILGLGTVTAMWDNKPQWNKYFIIISGLGILCWGGLLQFTAPSRSFSALPVNLRPMAEVLFAGSFAILIRSISNISPSNVWLARFEKCGTLLAAFSYTLYLTHYQTMTILANYWSWKHSMLSLKAFITLFYGVGISIVTAVVLYFMFERPTKDLKKILYRKLGI